MNSLSLFILLVLVCNVSSRGIWGSKRKQVEEEPSAPAPKATRARQQQTGLDETGMGGMMGSGGIGGLGGLSGLGGIGSMGGMGGSGKTGNAHVDDLMEKAMAGFDGLIEMIQSDQFAEFITPETIKEAFANVPGIEEYAEVMTLLDSPQFQDADMLKTTIVEGIQTLKMYLGQMGGILSDADLRNTMLGELPLEMRRAIDGIVVGNYRPVRDYLENPELGLGQTNIDMIMSLLEGDTDGLQTYMSDLLNDAGHVEETRKMLLENEEMAESLGIDMSTVRDAKKWKKMIADAKDQLGGDGLDGIREKAATTDRKFRIPGMA